MNEKLVGITLLLCSNVAVAMPSVSGSTISWPDDGWYQVQRADTFESVCGGSLSCDVEPGTYIVINHSTGERFPGIVVGSTESQIVVSGNSISWPDDGWYQVQDRETFESVCEGGQSCDVENGSYIVINHSTGTRYTGITVPGDANSNPIVASGSTISWPDDGWYQVQNNETFASICNGERSCEVSNGTYIVINHTTGVRFDNIKVGDGRGLIRTIGANRLIVAANRISRGGWLNPLEAWAGFGGSGLSDILVTTPISVNDDGSETFSCPISGSATLTVLDPDNFSDPRLLVLFDNCSGESFSANGTLIRKLEVSGSRTSAITITNFEFDNFEFSVESDNTIRIEAGSSRRAGGTYNSGPGCSDLTGSSLMYDVAGLQLFDGSMTSQSVTGSYEGNYRLSSSAVSDGTTSGVSCIRREKFDERANIDVLIPELSGIQANIQSSVGITRGGTISDRDANAASIDITFNAEETLRRSLVSDDELIVQQEIFSGGSSTSENVTYDFYPGSD